MIHPSNGASRNATLLKWKCIYFTALIGIFAGVCLRKQRGTLLTHSLAETIERTFAWLNQFRRLRLRYEKRSDMHKAFLSFACALICWNFLQGHFP